MNDFFQQVTSSTSLSWRRRIVRRSVW